MPSHAPVVVVDAVRSAIGRRNGTLAHTHPNEILGTILSALVERTGIDPMRVGQVVGGCVGQVGAQSSNVIRNAWLTAGPPPRGAGHDRQRAVRLGPAVDDPGPRPRRLRPDRRRDRLRRRGR